jgi:biopolymer transport protein TolQ
MQDKYRIANRNKGNILSDSFRYAYDEAMNQIRGKDKDIPEIYKLDIESIERAMFLKINEGISRIENKLNFLATTASVTPFIGLFGTVWGIMDAFRQIGLQGSADLATVAPGISEALINTAAGLFAAIPAVIAYNYFLKKIKESSSLSENFVLEVANIFQKIKY